MICDVAAPQQLITASSCNIHFDDDKRSLTCLGFVIARLQSTPTMIPDAPPSVPASTGGLLTAQTASRVARSVTSPKSPAGHLERALSDAHISTPTLSFTGASTAPTSSSGIRVSHFRNGPRRLRMSVWGVREKNEAASRRAVGLRSDVTLVAVIWFAGPQIKRDPLSVQEEAISPP